MISQKARDKNLRGKKKNFYWGLVSVLGPGLRYRMKTTRPCCQEDLKGFGFTAHALQMSLPGSQGSLCAAPGSRCPRLPGVSTSRSATEKPRGDFVPLPKIKYFQIPPFVAKVLVVPGGGSALDAPGRARRFAPAGSRARDALLGERNEAGHRRVGGGGAPLPAPPSDPSSRRLRRLSGATRWPLLYCFLPPELRSIGKG